MADMSHCALGDGGPGGTATSELDQRGNLTNAAVDAHGSPRDSRERCEPPLSPSDDPGGARGEM